MKNETSAVPYIRNQRERLIFELPQDATHTQAINPKYRRIQNM
jgi:hypothetical protein